MDLGLAVIFDVDSGLYRSYVRFLGPKRNLSSALVGVLMSSSKFFLFFQRSSFKLSCETVIGIVLCYSHQECCLLYYLGEINMYSGIHIYQFTFELLHSCFRVWLWFRIWTKISADRRIWRKKARIGGFAYSCSSPSVIFW